MQQSLCQTNLLNKTNGTLHNAMQTRVECNDGSISANAEGGSGSGGYRKLPCGYCDENCMYKAVEIGFIIGVIANTLVIIRVIKDKRLRDPTFVGIAALALADLLFLILNLTISFETVVVTFTCQTPKLQVRPWYVLRSMIWFSANSHVALLAILRYITIANPLKSSVMLTPKRVIILSAGVWILGMILLGILAGLITLKIIVPGTSGEYILIWWITVYLIPLIVTTILHILKYFRVKMATKGSATLSTRRSINRMSKIVPLVIVMATVLPLPTLIFNCFRASGYIFPSKSFKMHCKGIAHLVYLINHFINPFIYGFLSNKFRKSLKQMFSCSHTKHNNTVSPNSPVSSKKGTFSTEPFSRNLSSISSAQSPERPRICRIDSDDSNRNLSSVSSYESVDYSQNCNGVNKCVTFDDLHKDLV